MNKPLAMAAILAMSAPLAMPHDAAAQPAAAQVMSYSDAAFQDSYSAVVIDPYNLQGGPRAAFVGVLNSAAILGALRTQRTDPQADVAIMDATTAAIACKEGLLEPTPPELQPILDPLDPQAKDAGACGPGVTFDHLVVAYDAALVKPAPVSIRAMLNPRWRGKVSLQGPPNIQALALTAILAHADSGDWHNADGAFRLLKEIAPQVQTFEPQPDPYTLILNGTLAFATSWNARAQLYSDRSNGRLGVMLPTEGTVVQINTISLVKGGPNRAAGLAFIRYALSPPAQKAFAERMFYGPTNTATQVSPEVAARTAASAENKARVVAVDWNEVIKLRDAWTQRWRRDVIAASVR